MQQVLFFGEWFQAREGSFQCYRKYLNNGLNHWFIYFSQEPSLSTHLALALQSAEMQQLSYWALD